MGIKINGDTVINNNRNLTNLGVGSGYLLFGGPLTDNALAFQIGNLSEASTQVSLTSLDLSSSSGNYVTQDARDMIVIGDLKVRKTFTHRIFTVTSDGPNDMGNTVNLGFHDFCWNSGITITDRGDGSEWWKCHVSPSDNPPYCGEFNNEQTGSANVNFEAVWCAYYGVHNSTGDDDNLYCHITCLDFE